jgi:hypothetical protein
MRIKHGNGDEQCKFALGDAAENTIMHGGH